MSDPAIEITDARVVSARGRDRGFDAFRVAWAFWAVAAGLGLILRWNAVWPVPGVNVLYLTHAHSHVAFLGWVFNAFFALALRFFVPAAERGAFWRLFALLQIATAGMLIAYPLQGYGAVSVTFSTLHLVGSGVFAWRLWRRSVASPIARRYLRVALAFMVVSGAGPLALGPLAGAGLRESPVYALAIYFYLHCQYNGWFMFFLQAVWLQRRHDRGLVENRARADKALKWLAAGCVFSFALAALWLKPPGWVYAVAAAGGAAQLVGAGYFSGCIWNPGTAFGPRHATVVRGLAALAVTAFGLKLALQFVGSWPSLAVFAGHRFTVIGFLHLVFLGVVTPMVVAWAVEFGWLQVTRKTVAGLALYLTGAAVTEIVLMGMPLAGFSGYEWIAVPETLLAAAGGMVAGVLLLAGGLDLNQGESGRRGA